MKNRLQVSKPQVQFTSILLSVHLKSGLVKGLAIGERSLIRGELLYLYIQNNTINEPRVLSYRHLSMYNKIHLITVPY